MNYTVKVHAMIHQRVEYLYYGNVSVINSKCTQGLHKFMVTCIDNVPIPGH